MSAADKKRNAGDNPLKFDPELVAMLDKIEYVKTHKAFKRWRGSFLSRFESFLEQDNIVNAKKAYQDFSKSMEEFVKMTKKVEDYTAKGELAATGYTVKARQCFAEMCKKMTLVIQEEEALIPSTGQLEKKRGYNKFHMGAVLVRDGFQEYGRLTVCGDVLKHMREVSLGAVADKQILEEMENYSVKLQKFCDIMADLGLYEVMLKCMELAEEPEEVIEDLIFLDIKTGCIGELPREDCLSHRLVTLTKDADGNDVFNEAEADEEKKAKLLKLIVDNNKLGIGFGKSQNTYEDETVAVAEMEKISAMWGVKLKKTPKNVKGEELVFVDRKTGAFGELSRRMCMEAGVITETKDARGKFIIGEAEHEFEERSNLVELIRSLLKVGVQSG